MLRKRKVLKWIKRHFRVNEIIIEDTALFPNAKRVIDYRNKEHAIVFYDSKREQVALAFPYEEKQREKYHKISN
ncbi:MAG TPA: hypothetical protein VFK33_02385 [Bacillales bacterium]|nr:hypothetical protein [Bacillales bacterium]